MSDPVVVEISCLNGLEGKFSLLEADTDSPIWARLKLLIRAKNLTAITSKSSIQLSWADTLGIVRELGSKPTQRELNFRFKPIGDSAERISKFAKQIHEVNLSRNGDFSLKSHSDIEQELIEKGFTKRKLKPFQLRDLSHLLSLQNGANFSVPGAGKTTVTFALHILIRNDQDSLIIVAPKAAKQAWVDVVEECIPESNEFARESFVVLDGDEQSTLNKLNSDSKRFIISYDLLIRQQSVVSNYIAQNPTHLVLDESHRMKAGWLSQRGAFLLSISGLPIRRDILSGTPMPQAATDIQSQLDFLWPGHGLGNEINYEHSPRKVLGKLYVRTTKSELNLPPVERNFYDVAMASGQLVLYSIVRKEFLRNFSATLSSRSGSDIVLKARKSVMRLLQLSANPMLALNAMMREHVRIDSGVVDQVLEEGLSNKMQAVIKHARDISAKGEKCVIWTIFTNSIETLAAELAELNPVVIHGGVPSGDKSNPDTREGKIRRFHEDGACSILIANPAAAGEGISLHTVCHNAIYLDRSYVSTHYLQSIDRIHRLGVPPNQNTYIHIYRTKAPAQVGSIDLSVSRRLTEKIRNMQELLDDPDLHQIAYDEEEADDPIDYDINMEDLIDLISELEGRNSSAQSEEE